MHSVWSRLLVEKQKLILSLLRCFIQFLSDPMWPHVCLTLEQNIWTPTGSSVPLNPLYWVKKWYIHPLKLIPFWSVHCSRSHSPFSRENQVILSCTLHAWTTRQCHKSECIIWTCEGRVFKVKEGVEFKSSHTCWSFHKTLSFPVMTAILFEQYLQGMHSSNVLSPSTTYKSGNFGKASVCFSACRMVK